MALSRGTALWIIFYLMFDCELVRDWLVFFLREGCTGIFYYYFFRLGALELHENSTCSTSKIHVSIIICIYI